MSKTSADNLIERPPVIAIMGHVDHGKSSLLDYIRKSNVVAGEAGGITQSVSAYEVEHKNEAGDVKKITFIDTPGHAAFSGMRQRGATIADIAILIISAEDSVKEQTKEAIQIIKDSNTPFLVAINKIDLPHANVERVKTSLMEYGIFLEGYGGDVPYVAISAKTGVGVNELLETILLLAELQEFRGNPEHLATGYIVESHLDPQRGISATLIIKDGTIKKGNYIVAGCGIAATRIMENHVGDTIDQAQFSSPIVITGFSTQCSAGSMFETYETKKDAEQALAHVSLEGYAATIPSNLNLDKTNIVPIILKVDVNGMIEPLANEIEKISGDGLFYKIIKANVGDVNESDVRLGASDEGTIIIGFNVKEDNKIKNMNEYNASKIVTFDIIYKISEWLLEIKEERRFREQIEETIGTLKILKIFSQQKKNSVIGGRVKTGEIKVKQKIKIIRRETEIGRGIIDELQAGKMPAEKVMEDMECGMNIATTTPLAEGDLIEAFKVVIK